jgi:hypothetical protein
VTSRHLPPDLAAQIAAAAELRARELMAEQPIAPATVDLLRTTIGPVTVHRSAA